MVDEATRKAKALIEALPYLKRFHHQFVVVKLGGEIIEQPEVLEPLLVDLVFLELVGVRPILVHGGGSSITRAMNEAGIEPSWYNGRRVTDERTMAIVQRESERLNIHLVDRLFELGGAAIGLVPSRHQGVVHGRRHDPRLGLVGRPVGIDGEKLTRYVSISSGLIPVVPPLSVDETGEVLNTNADDVALSLAIGMSAAKLVFFSNVPGVCTDPMDPATRISSLTPDDVHRLIDDGVIRGGMIPKVESCIGALRSGVQKIHIIHAATPHALLLEIYTREGVGTELYLDPDGGD